MDADTQKKLREKFDVERIGKKPKITCKACSDSRSKVCNDHKKVRCSECQQYVTERHMHVEFVGHANVTDRLLEVDPNWDWEPMAFGPDGLPAFDANGGLWIRLTVAGVTRIGYGGADGKRGEDAVKEAIGDAIKVAAMRFGVGLDLWRKEEASGKTADDTPPAAQQATPPQQRTNGQQRRQQPAEAAQPASSSSPTEARARLAVVCEENGWDLGIVANRYKAAYGEDLGSATDAKQIDVFAALLFGISDAELKAPATNGASR